MGFISKSIFNKDYKQPSAKEVKNIFLFGGLLCLIFIAFIFNSRFAKNDRYDLKFEDEVSIKVSKIRNYKGFLTLNDSLIISSNVIAINKPDYQKNEVLLEYIDKPYILKKEKNTYEFEVIANQFTYTFRLFEDNGF
jgi:hypothetical protein